MHNLAEKQKKTEDIRQVMKYVVSRKTVDSHKIKKLEKPAD